jgi:hypothetical protein
MIKVSLQEANLAIGNLETMYRFFQKEPYNYAFQEVSRRSY